jgi:hypothetical protein
MTTTTCSCGMFAVGNCATCGQPRCGQHASHDANGYFVCNEHIMDARQQAADEQAQRRDREVDDAKAAVDAEKDALRKAFPGLPVEGPASPAQLASVLSRHAADKRKEFEIARKSFGRRTVAHGWAFLIGDGAERQMGREKLYLVVTTDGGAYRCARVGASAPPTDIMAATDAPERRIEARHVRKVTKALVEWSGKSNVLVATSEQRYLVEFHANGGGPRYDDWLQDNA